MKNFLRKNGVISTASSLLAIVVGLLIGFVILLITNPAQALPGLGYILRGGFSGGMKGLGEVLYYATPIIMTGLAVGFAFKTGLFNIGATGQFLVGGFVAILIGVKFTFLPGATHWIVALIAGALAGGLVALVPGVFKALFNVNEVISSIMMNYITMHSVNLLIRMSVYDSAVNKSMDVALTAEIPKVGLNTIFSTQIGNVKSASALNAGFFIAIAAAIVIYIILNKTIFGYELKACGFNREASRYAGISAKQNIILSMVIAGMLAGLGGALLHLSGPYGRHITVLDELTAEGFTGIAVALLGLSQPIGIIFAGLFISYIQVGGNYMQRLDFVPEVINIIVAAIIYCSAFSLVFKGVITKLLTGGKRGVKEPAPGIVPEKSPIKEDAKV